MNSCALFLFLSILTVSHIKASDFYSYSVKDVDGKTQSLEKYRGKVTLVVNVASLCGYTDATYRALSKIHDILSWGDHFSVLAFPCNQFGDQEPEDAETVRQTVMQEYGVEFPIFDKIEVIGENASPAFRNLYEQSSKVPEWNFYKYLVGPDGEVMNAWGTRTELDEIFPEVQEAVQAAEARAKAGAQQHQEEETVPEEAVEDREEL